MAEALQRLMTPWVHDLVACAALPPLSADNRSAAGMLKLTFLASPARFAGRGPTDRAEELLDWCRTLSALLSVFIDQGPAPAASHASSREAGKRLARMQGSVPQLSAALDSLRRAAAPSHFCRPHP